MFRAALSLDLHAGCFPDRLHDDGANASLTRDTIRDDTTLDGGRTGGRGPDPAERAGHRRGLTLGLVSLLPGTDTVDWGFDPSVSIPLLRGAGRHIVTEPLTQAERDVIYEMWDFERYKRTFAVDIAQQYYNVLRQMDSLTNSENNYRSAVQSARWSRRQADAGRITEIEVDQAVQRELSSRNSWISAQERIEGQPGLVQDARSACRRMPWSCWTRTTWCSCGNGPKSTSRR